MEQLISRVTYTGRKIRKPYDFTNQIAVIEKYLTKLGLSKNEAKIYLFLARTGEKKAREISEALSLYRTETYQALRSLERNGLVFSVFGRPLKFTAIPLEVALELLIEMRRKKIEEMEKERARIFKIWASLPKLEEAKMKRELFQILEGREQIFLRLDKMISRSKVEIYIHIPGHGFRKLYTAGLIEKLKEASNRGVKVSILTNDSLEASFFLEMIKHLNIEVILVSNHFFTNSSFNFTMPFFLISDKEELLIILRERRVKNGKKVKDMALWTNHEVLVNTFCFLFSIIEKIMDVLGDYEQ
ncbi:MAG: hypothetical protein NDF54_08125 [archaeon GB-1867-035]|nr:hypothetical protein [Candidatus Culexmicrobium profundum]